MCGGDIDPSHQKKAAGEKLTTKLADLRAELEAARCEVRLMRATADGLNDEVIKLAAEKAALKTEITTRTMACSRALAYKYKTEEAGQYREELQALDIKNLRHEQFENPKPPCVIVISVPLIKSRRIRCLTPQKHEVHRAKYGRLCLLASLSMY